MSYKCLFIDLDDTLWDTYHNNKECLRELYAEQDLGRYYASFEAFFSIYMPIMWIFGQNIEVVLLISRL